VRVRHTMQVVRDAYRAGDAEATERKQKD